METPLLQDLAQAKENLRHQHPSSSLWAELGRVQWRQGDFAAAKRSFAKGQALGEATASELCDFGVLRMTTGDPVDLAIPLFRQALEREPGHPGALEWLAYARMVRQDYQEAVDLYLALRQAAPMEPRFLLLLGQAQQRAGKAGEAGASLEAAFRLNALMYQHTKNEGYLTHMVLCLFVAGQEAQAAALLAQMRAEYGKTRLDWDHPEYLPDTPARLARCRELVAGRDLVILAKGPSLARFDQAVERFAEHDLCYFIFNGSQAEDAILAKIGRRASLACMSAANVLRNNLAWLQDFLARPQEGVFFTDAHCMNSLAEDGVDRPYLESRFDRRLVYFKAAHKFLPSWADPLNFPPINTLSMVLPLAVLAQPRRIFLFGCDGAAYRQASDQDPALYFFGDQEKVNAGERALGDYRRGYEQWLGHDTFLFDSQIKATLACLAATHGLEVPEIYNCSPNSAYQSFPKLGTGACLSLLRR